MEVTVTRPLRVLVIDDSEDDVMLLLRELRRGGYEVEHRRVETAEAMEAALDAQTWDILLCDYAMPRFSAPEALRVYAGRASGAPFIVVSGVMGEDRAVECMRAGAHDFILKDRLARLVPAVERELAEAAAHAEQERTKEQLGRAEDALVRSAQVRALGQMAAGVTHDLKNILHPIALYLQLLERSLAQGDIAEAQGCVAEMRQVLRCGLEVVERLRGFSRQSSEMKVEAVDLNYVAHEAARIATARLRSDVGAQATTIEEELGAPPPIQAHAAEVVSALVNLIVNAIDAMPEGGTISLRTGESREGAWVQVADNGPGMPPEVERRVFEPFFSTKGDAGTGLGLAMVYACVTRHRGTITLETAPGRGAKFTAWFPAGGPPKA